MAIEQRDLQSVSNKKMFGAEVTLATVALSLDILKERGYIQEERVMGAFEKNMQGYISDDEIPENKEDWTYDLLVRFSAVGALSLRQLVLNEDIMEDQISEAMVDAGVGVSRSLDVHRHARRYGINPGDRAKLLHAGISIAGEMVFGDGTETMARIAGGQG